MLSALPSYQDMGRPFGAFVFAIAAHKVADAARGAARSPPASPPGPSRPAGLQRPAGAPAAARGPAAGRARDTPGGSARSSIGWKDPRCHFPLKVP